MNNHKTGVVFAVVLGGFHLVWSVLVALGWAQKIYDFILWAHMVHLNIVIGPFNMTAAIMLVIMTALIGYVFGYFGSWVWNKVRPR